MVSTADNTASSFTAGDMRLFASILKHADGPINTDWEAVAKEIGLKDGSIAKVRYRQIKKSKIETEENGKHPSGITKKKPSTRKSVEKGKIIGNTKSMKQKPNLGIESKAQDEDCTDMNIKSET